MLYDTLKKDIAQVIDVFVITAAMDTLGSRIKARREELGLDQVQLAKLASISQPTLANLESGKNKRTKFLPELAEALNTSVEWLDKGVAPTKPSEAADVAVELRAMAELNAIYAKLEPVLRERLLTTARNLERMSATVNVANNEL